MTLDKLLLLHAWNFDALIETVREKGRIIQCGYFFSPDFKYFSKTFYNYEGHYFLIYTVLDHQSEKGLSKKIDAYPTMEIAEEQYKLLFTESDGYIPLLKHLYKNKII